MMLVLLAAAAVAALPALRIVSLAPAVTEDLFAIGAGPQVVGVDAYSRQPPAARHLPRVGTLQTANVERILALHPDLVVGIPYEAAQLRQLSRAGLRVESLRVDSLADDLHGILTLGRLTGRLAPAQALVRRLRQELTAWAARAARKPTLRAFVVISTSPIYTAGHGSYINDLLRLANVRNVAEDLRAAWPSYSAERLLVDQPDVLVLPAAMPIPQTPPWAQLDAVKQGRIVRLDDEEFLHPGPHVARALASLVMQLDRYRRPPVRAFTATRGLVMGEVSRGSFREGTM